MEKTITKDMLDWKFDDSVFVELECWTSHPTLVLSDAKTDPDTKHKVGAIKQLLKFIFKGTTLRQACTKAASDYRISYQNGYSRNGNDEDYKNVNKYLIKEDGTERDKLDIILDTFFTGRQKMTEGEKRSKAIDNIANLDEIRNVRERLAIKEKELKAELAAQQS